MAMDACESLLLIQAEFDGELDAAEAASALRHREGCAQCRAAYADLQSTRALIADAPYHRAPENLRRSLIAGLGAAAPARRRALAWWREGASFVLGAAVAAGIALFVLAPAQQNLLDAVVSSHIRALQPGHLEDLVSTDRHTVKPWFDGRLDFAPPVKDLASAGFPLIGGRLDYLDDHAAAALVYRRDRHLIDLYVWPGQGTTAPVLSMRNGYNAVHWSEDGMIFWAVSDLEAGQLRDFVRLWRAGATG